jgi:Dyp-type peroxidase family
MARTLDLPDIQGNIVRAYGGSFPKARYLCLHFRDPEAGRTFVGRLLPRITTAVKWTSTGRRSAKVAKIARVAKPSPKAYPSDGAVAVEKPQVCVNLALSHRGLVALRLPTATLSAMPPEFIDGMARRARILGDGATWEDVWKGDATEIHALVSLSAQMDADTGDAVPELDAMTRWIRDLCAERHDGVVIVGGHGPSRADALDASALLQRTDDGVVPLPTEHFGFTDGFGDPAFDGQHAADQEAAAAVGRGKQLPGGAWAPIATGEFLLGYPDEAQEVPPAAMPHKFTRNGTFLVFRKLHEHVASFESYIGRVAEAYAASHGTTVADAAELIRAKMAGRWRDGVPISVAPGLAEWRAFTARAIAARASNDAAAIAAIERAYMDFGYANDPTGSRCPITAHIRRANTRDALDPYAGTPAAKGSILNNRRRLLRRGLPYGTAGDPPRDDGEHGVIFVALCASIFRQFEFVQQQWLQYGLDFGAGSDTCPITGHRDGDAKFVIAGDAATPPFICAGMPPFVESRGGEYFFVPSLTALRMIAMGVVDPT